MVPALEEAAAGVPTFTLGLKGLGAFPGLDHPRTLWVGVSEGVQEVQRLQARVAEALERRGTPIEPRAWQAHVTIGRVTDEKRWRREGMPELRSAVMRGATAPFGSHARHLDRAHAERPLHLGRPLHGHRLRAAVVRVRA